MVRKLKNRKTDSQLSRKSLLTQRSYRAKLNLENTCIETIDRTSANQLVIPMKSTKAIFISALLTFSALAFAEDTIKIGHNWTKDLKYKIKTKSEFEVSGLTATIEATTSWSGEVGKDGYSVTVHHDEIKVIAGGNDANPPVSDLKFTFDHTRSMTTFEGGIDGADSLRMFLIGQFFAPTEELTKDKVAKWDVAKNEKTSLGALKIETTYQGDEKVGEKTFHKFKQVVAETGTEYSITGTYFVTDNGQVMKSKVTFKGLPIPVASGEAAGSYSSAVVE